MALAKKKRKLTAGEKQARRERKEKFMTIFINGKQKRVPRPPTIEGVPIDEFIERNADPIWLHQNGMWELIPIENELPADSTTTEDNHSTRRSAPDSQH